MARVVLVHITSSGHGIRIIFTADKKIGNLADQQISFASVLGYTPDQSTIDATRNSFAPKEDEILFIDEERLFTYYDEDFDREFTPQYRDKKTQPLYHQFPTDNPAAGADCSKTAAVAGKAAVAGAGDVGQVDAEPVSLTWRGYDVQSIIDARYAEKLPCAADSNRHAESLKLATEARQWRVQPLVLLKRKRSMLLLCPQRRCSLRFRSHVVRRIRRLRKRRRRR